MARFIKLHGQDHPLPPGVEIFRKSIRIGFTYQGRYWYETLAGEISLEAINRARIKREAITLEIQEGTFDYRRHFPDSKNAMKVNGLPKVSPNATLCDMLDEEATLVTEKKAPSTVRAELTRHVHILSFFGRRTPVRYITVEDVDRFKRQLRRTHSASTVNNTLVVLRSILKRAYQRDILLRRLDNRFENLPASETRPEEKANPLTLAEMDKLGAIKTDRIGDRDMFLFNCWVGLSVSELVALAWSDVDTSRDTWRINVRRARPREGWKVPKALGRVRTVELNDQAKAYLAAQRPRTALMPPITVDVLQRDNQTVVPEEIRPVFRNEVTDNPWHPTTLGEHFRRLCKKAEIEERGANQCRHTFASRMLTGGLPLNVLAQLLGHVGEEMIKRHYGRWIADDVNGRTARLMNLVIADMKSHRVTDEQS